MYTVMYREDGVEKKSEAFEDRDAAFDFQNKLLIRRVDESVDIETLGVWSMS